jgi:hypothetical protein
MRSSSRWLRERVAVRCSKACLDSEALPLPAERCWTARLKRPGVPRPLPSRLNVPVSRFPVGARASALRQSPTSADRTAAPPRPNAVITPAAQPERNAWPRKSVVHRQRARPLPASVPRGPVVRPNASAHPVVPSARRRPQRLPPRPQRRPRPRLRPPEPRRPVRRASSNVSRGRNAATLPVNRKRVAALPEVRCAVCGSSA